MRTPLPANADSALLRTAAKAAMFLLYPLTVSAQDCAEYMWHGVFNSTGDSGSAGVRGAWRIDSKGENMGSKSYFGNESQRKKLWEHTWESVSVD